MEAFAYVLNYKPTHEHFAYIKTRRHVLKAIKKYVKVGDQRPQGRRTIVMAGNTVAFKCFMGKLNYLVVVRVPKHDDFII